MSLSDSTCPRRARSPELTRLPGVARVHSSFALRAVARLNVLPIR